MKWPIKRKDVVISPDNFRVIARFFFNGEERVKLLLEKLLILKEGGVEQQILQTHREFSGQHHSITGLFDKHFNSVKCFAAQFSTGKN